MYDKIKDVMSKPILKVQKTATIVDAAKKMAKHNVGCLVVASKDKLIGIITERDITNKVVGTGKDPKKVKVKDVMLGHVVTINPNDSVFAASKIMEEHHFRRLPVMKNNKLIGIVTETDIAHAERESAIDTLKKKVSELELFNRMAIGRELRMRELKKRIRELEGRKR